MNFRYAFGSSSIDDVGYQRAPSATPPASSSRSRTSTTTALQSFMRCAAAAGEIFSTGGASGPASAAVAIPSAAIATVNASEARICITPILSHEPVNFFSSAMKRALVDEARPRDRLRALLVEIDAVSARGQLEGGARPDSP